MFSNSSRRQSTSSIPVFNSSQIPQQGIGFSPPTPAGSGIPAFRSLRSLLPFGPKTPNSSFAVSSPSSSSPFAGFGSVRRSIQKDRERTSSLANDVLRPVIAIERSSSLSDESVVRRSASLSRLEKPLPHPNVEGEWDTPFTLRTPSPGPPLSAELSTIMEADSSGVSKILPPRPSSPHLALPSSLPTRLGKPDAITSGLDLSPTHVAAQVRDAILASDASPNSVKQWRGVDKAVVVIDADPDEEEHTHLADTSFNLDTAHPDLVALLSPHSLSKNNSTQSLTMNRTTTAPQPPITPVFSLSHRPKHRQVSSFLPRLRPSTSSNASATVRNFTTATSPSSPSAIATPTPAKGKAPLIFVNNNNGSSPEQQNSPTLTSATTPVVVVAATPRKSLSGHSGRTPVSTPGNSVSISNVNSGGLRGPKKFLHVVAGMGGSKGTTETPAKNVSAPPSPNIVQSGMIMSVGRSSHDSRRSPAAQDAGIGLGRPSLEIRRGSSYALQRRQASPSELLLANRSSTSPEEQTTPNADSSPSPSPCEEPRYHHRPSMDSNTRPSFDGSRPNPNRLLVDDEDRTQRQTPLLKILDSSGDGSRFGGGVSPVPRSSVSTQARSRKRSMSVQEKMGGRSGRLFFPGGAGAGASVLPRPGSSLSVGRGSRGGYVYGEANESNGGGGGVPKPEWLGPRTAKAFRAAGLLDHHDREKGGSGPGSVLSKEREREASLSGGNGNDVLDRLRERSGSGSVVSANGVLAPSPLGYGVGGGGGGGSSAIHRFASLRASSEYNRSQSRMTFSDVGGPIGPTTISRRGSESISAYGGGGNACGLMESPTFSYSGSSGSRGERDRDTPRSTTTSSTALTSLSESFGYFGREREREKDRDRDREWEDIRELKEKHSTEVAALLSALSDSQRTVRMLREENSGLRERLDRVVVGEVSHSRENEELKRAYEGLQLEFEGLRRECGRLQRRLSISVRAPASAPGIAPSWSGSSASVSSGLRTPKPVNSSPLATDVTSRFYHQDEYNDTVVIHDSIDGDEHEPFRRRRAFLDTDVDVDDDKVVVDDNDEDPLNAIPPTSESTPLIHRRLSNSSSIFPVPPPNMTMLLDVDDDNEGALPAVATNSNRSSAHYRLSLPVMEDSLCAPSMAIPIPKPKQTYLHSGSPPPVAFKNFTGSVVSEHNMSVSPTTADFSIVTGGGGSSSSPRSLFLRPEHELLLGDMESFDLGGVVPPIELHSSELRDDW